MYDAGRIIPQSYPEQFLKKEIEETIHLKPGTLISSNKDNYPQKQINK